MVEIRNTQGPSESAMEPPFDLVVDGATKHEMLLSIDLLEMEWLVDPVRLVNLVVCFYSKSMGPHSEMPQGSARSMHPVVKSI